MVLTADICARLHTLKFLVCALQPLWYRCTTVPIDYRNALSRQHSALGHRPIRYYLHKKSNRCIVKSIRKFCFSKCKGPVVVWWSVLVRPEQGKDQDQLERLRQVTMIESAKFKLDSRLTYGPILHNMPSSMPWCMPGTSFTFKGLILSLPNPLTSRLTPAWSRFYMVYSILQHASGTDPLHSPTCPMMWVLYQNLILKYQG
jgi:hypothetical protein